MNQSNSVASFASALYSASELDQDTMPCFFDPQATSLSQRYIAKPVVERRVCTYPPQSASLKPYRLSLEQEPK